MTDVGAALTGMPQVVSFLVAQHEQIKEMFADVTSSMGSVREQAFLQLRQLLAVHESAEQNVIHLRARHELDAGNTIVDERLAEEAGAAELIAELEQLDIESTQFETGFRKLQADVIAHADAEEHTEFVGLAADLDNMQLGRMRVAQRLSASVGGGVDQPGAPDGEPVLRGDFATMLERAAAAICA